MSKHRNWKQQEAIFHEALALAGDEREAFLVRTCARDNETLVNVRRLLEAFENNAAFLEEPGFEAGLTVLHKTGALNLEKSVIGSYQIGKKIGEGGMGEVYEAVDTKLNRRVALKFLADSFNDDNQAIRQLKREAQAVAMLDHPNICSIYGIEEVGKYHFIVMQFIDGVTLAEAIKESRIEPQQIISIIDQILSAAAFAHSHGVIHRDLKPANIMIKDDGQIKVLDFGLAKTVKVVSGANEETTSLMSQDGLIIGTVAYMSPEQLRGEKLDFQTDIFSIGIVLHELISGKNPFARNSQAETIAAVLSEAPMPVVVAPSHLPFDLTNLIAKCLLKDKGARFQSVAEIQIALDNAANQVVVSSSSNKPPRLYYLKAGLAALLLFVGLFITYSAFLGTTPRTIAVLPITFENAPPGKEYLADGLTRSIIDKLSDLTYLDVRNESLILRYRGKEQDAVIAGQELNVQTIFAGAMRNREDGLFLESRLIRVSDGGLMAGPELRKIDETSLVELPQNIASQIVDLVQAKLTAEDEERLTRKDTESDAAKDLYLHGRFFLKRGRAGDDIEKAAQFFLEAKDLDQNYAKAWAGLADAYLSMSAPGVKGAVPPDKAVNYAKTAAKKALELDSTLCETYHSLGLISLRYEWNWTEAEGFFRTAIARDPEFLPARVALINLLGMQGRLDEALTEAARIKEYDPFSISSDLEIAKVYYRQKNFTEMDKVVDDLIQKFPDNRRVVYLQTYLLLNTGRYQQAIDILAKMYQSNNEEDKVLAAAPLGFAYAKMGRRAEALKMIEDLGRLRNNNYVPAQEKALVYVGLGDYDNVFAGLAQSCAERFHSLPGWITDPIVDEVKADPRFAEIKKCVNL